MRYDILHITVHLGGGIGTVLMNWIETDVENRHTILCLNRNYYASYDPGLVMENMRWRYLEIAEWVRNSDVVVVHFWNHPLLFEFLTRFDFPPCRLCFWSHVSGLNAPYVFSEKLVNLSDRFVFASPISYETKEVKAFSCDLKERLSHIWTAGNVNGYSKIQPIPHDGFNVGCIGTLDYSKLHPNFLDFCGRINIPDVRFILCGDGCDSGKMKSQVKEMGMEDKFSFTGVVTDIRPYLAVLDVFGYPLNPTHFGTCEQVIGEAVAAGVIPVVMKNPAEEYILLQSLVRFVCSSEDEYVHNIELLYRERTKRKSIISLMQEHIVKLYDSDRMVSSWNDLFFGLVSSEKKSRRWEELEDKSGYGIFVESLGNYGKVLKEGSREEVEKMLNSNLQWKSSSKGSPKQYLETFPDDASLRDLVEMI